AGYDMDYLECKYAKHVEGGTWSMPEQMEWASGRLAGKPLANPCIRTDPVCCKGTIAPVGECIKTK
ncbi:MAG: hypothetical protein WC405_21450, partial [Syntrophales bacterium]